MARALLANRSKRKVGRESEAESVGTGSATDEGLECGSEADDRRSCVDIVRKNKSCRQARTVRCQRQDAAVGITAGRQNFCIAENLGANRLAGIEIRKESRSL